MKPNLIITEKWKRLIDDVEMYSNLYSIPGGVIYEMYSNNVRVIFQFSKRPYILGQACDGTIDDCVFALFFDFCRNFSLDASELLLFAYCDDEPFSLSDQKRITKIALKQGVEFPKIWCSKAFKGLLESLTEINYHSLVSILEELELNLA